MKQLLTILLLVVPLLGNAQSRPALRDLMATSSPQQIQVAEARIRNFVLHLDARKSSSDVTFLKKIFRQTQKAFLNNYATYSDFSEIFSTGKYDCLTATSLFSVVLDQLDFSYNVIETNYHIFVLVKTANGEVLLETTDRFGGFVRDRQEIEKRIGSYRENLVKTIGDRKNLLYTFNLYREVNPTQLPGLLYYNQAVKAFNAGSLELCADLLVKAKSIYDTPRISEFRPVLMQSVLESKLDVQVKQRILNQIRNLNSKTPEVLASR